MGNLAVAPAAAAAAELPLGKHQKAFVKLAAGPRAECESPPGALQAWLAAGRKHSSPCILPSENTTSEGPSLRGVLPPQRKVAIISQPPPVLFQANGLRGRCHPAPEPTRHLRYLLCCQSHCEHTGSPTQPNWDCKEWRWARPSFPRGCCSADPQSTPGAGSALLAW